jgi:glycosyltransferase involved in cell wall biosynthesis
MEHRHLRSNWKRHLLHWENAFKLWRYERQVARRTEWQVVCGPDDEAFVRRYIHHSVPLAVIPNGVDPAYFHPAAAGSGPRADHPSILFCGAMDYNPNVDALRWYFAEIHEPLLTRVPNLRLWIVGKDPTPEVQSYGIRPNVTVTGAVPDVRPYYRRAWLQIVPLRIGGGTRLKIVESLAMGTPVVSTTVGAQGLELEHGQDVLLADSADEFVEQTAQALLDADRRGRLEKAGLETVRSRLAWPILGRRLSQLYAARLGGQRYTNLVCPGMATFDSGGLASQS